MLSGENRLSDGPPTDPAAAEDVELATPKPVCPKTLLPPAVPGAPVPKPVPKPPPVFAVEKLNAEAETNPDEAAGLSTFGAAKENVEAESVEEDPNPGGGCVGAAKVLPKPAEDDDDDDGAAKLKLLAWAAVGAPKPDWSEKL